MRLSCERPNAISIFLSNEIHKSLAIALEVVCFKLDISLTKGFFIREISYMKFLCKLFLLFIIVYKMKRILSVSFKQAF